MNILTVYSVLFIFLNIVTTIFIIFWSRRKTFDSVLIILCYAYTFGYDYRILGLQLAHILMMFILTCGWSARKLGKKAGNIKNAVILYSLYITAVTIIGYFFIRHYALRGSIIQNQLRPVVQIIQVIVLLYTVLVVLKFSYEESVQIIEKFKKVLMFIAILGIVQWIIFWAFRIDLFPMDRGEALSVVTERGGFLRATACLGEPKQLAKFTTLGVCLELFYGKYKYEKINMPNIIIYILATFASASTTGVLMVGSVIMLYAFMKMKKKGLGMIGIIAGLLFFIAILQIPFVAEKISYRVDVWGEIPGLEDCDTAVVRWLIANPIYTIWGVGLANTVGYAYEYIPIGSPWIAYYPFTLRRGIIQYIGESGIIGTLIMLYIFYQFILRSKKNLNLKYAVIFLVLMNLLLTVESITGVQLLLIALISNIAYKDEKIVKCPVAQGYNEDINYYDASGI